ncbi:hypothetical protein HanRHA438_Chr07g0311771 [Helianthus annuus]|uniref:Uncharacterized protein n=1 Tax=Helianthus annuus TaxID=4232 RepID=A0A9K3NGT5_HELAN|nr:hypothetical protein HanXRQr2_Chr07g0301871 [Helianthus annuus]KAJ0908562.1 hypothetical protein HanRHA438_Chr07g0311771 [Helianthus annuus]
MFVENEPPPKRREGRHAPLTALHVSVSGFSPNGLSLLESRDARPQSSLASTLSLLHISASRDALHEQCIGELKVQVLIFPFSKVNLQLLIF